MNIRILTTTLVLFLALHITVKAQTDSTLHQLGRIDLPKKFTQAVTIKASDIEKMPFTNVSDVVTTWLYGYYGGRGSYVYVVDGLLNTDVNAYSIYDIEEITMVQNAAAYLNGAVPGQVLLLVKTKRAAKAGSGVSVNGQTNLVNQRNAFGNGAKSTTNYYSQYYVSAYKNKGNVNAGISATFQHDVYPNLNYTNIAEKPYKIDRFKFNGYLTARLGSVNLLDVTVGYVPHNDDASMESRSFYSTSFYTSSYNSNGRQKLFYANAGLTSNIASGLVNKLNVGFQSRKTTLFFESATAQASGGGIDYATLSRSDSTSTLKSFVVNDDLSYNFRIGKVNVEPAVNFSYKTFDNVGALSTQTIVTPTGYINNNGRNVSNNSYLMLLTPSLMFNYDKAFVLQGGFQKSLNNNVYPPFKFNNSAALPFVNAGVDLFKLAKVAAGNSDLMITASYAKQIAIQAEQNINLSNIVSVFAGSATYPYASSVDLGRTFNQFQAGLTYAISNKRIAFSYNYQQIKAVERIAYAYTSTSSTYFEYSLIDQPIYINRFEVNADVLNKGNFKWRSVFNISLIKRDIPAIISQGNATTFLANINIVTGGFINRLAYKSFTGGLDVLYCFNQDRLTGSPSQDSKYNSFNLQNIYIGYTFKAFNLKNFEVYANSRNMFMNPNSTLTDNRRFYGLGFKADL